MATVIRTRRLVSNPRRRTSARKRARRRNARRGHRRRLTAKQIKFFGTKAQKSALRRRNSARYGQRKRKMASKGHRSRRRRNVAAGFYDEELIFHPIRASHDYSKKRAGESRKRRSRKNPKRRKRSNPALIVTLGAVNPKRRRRKAHVARKRRVNRHRRRSRKNATRVVVTAPRRRNRRRTYRRRNVRHYGRRRRRNPQLSFGVGVPASKTLTAIGGGLVGVAAAKFIPTLLPAGMVSSNLMRTVSTGISAFVAGWLAGKVNKDFGDAVMFGGFMQTGSTALNAFLPSVAGALGISGLGAFADASFVVPQNPIMAGVSVPAPAPRVTTSGIGRAFGNAF